MKKKLSLSGPVNATLVVLIIAILLLTLFSILNTSHLLISPKPYWVNIKLQNNQIIESDIQITVGNWLEVPPFLQRTIILRKDLSGILYLAACLLIMILLKRLYQKIFVAKTTGILGANHIRMIGVILFSYTICDFLNKLIFNLIISYNGYTQNSDNIHVGTRILPDFEIQLLIFALIIIVISDIYLKVTDIQDDLKLTI
ncbi:hypothetical protein JW948_03120 [bacterium]|nr:hypothetical protein [bacterium]